MRKILSLLTAFLFAGSMMATDFKEVTSVSELEAGAKYVIGTADGSFISNVSNTDNRKIAIAEVNDGYVTATSDMMIFTLGGEAGSWTFATDNYAGTAGYLNATNQTGSNKLKVVAELDDYAYFTVAIEDGVTTITCNGKTQRHILYLNGTTCFACYNNQTGQQYKKPSLFKLVESATYTVAGSSKPLFISEWNPEYTANDMKRLADGTYKWEKNDIELAAANVEFKVTKDHAWTTAYPSDNYQLALNESGIYDILIKFEPANGNKVSASATKKGDVVVLPEVVLHGDFSGSWKDSDPFTAAEDKKTATLSLDLAVGTYNFGFKFDGSWKANGAAITRDNNSTSLAEGSGDMSIVVDQAGIYEFVYTFDGEGLVVNYPKLVIDVTGFATVYQWNGKGASEAVQAGGTATAEGGNSNVVVGASQKGNWTIKLGKGFEKGTNYVGIALDQALAAGDVIQYAAFVADDSPTTVFGFDFGASKEEAGALGTKLCSNLQAVKTNAIPEDEYFVVPTEAAGAKYIRLFRNSGSATVYVANFSIFREGGEEPPVEVKYYMKNNWNAGADWTWKEMTKDGDTYKLEDVVFGGNGVNYAQDIEAADPAWVPVDEIKGDAIAAKDTVTFVLDPDAATVTATLIGKYNEGGDVPPVVVDKAYYLVGSAIGWAADEANKLVANPGAEGEFMITATLAVGDELKVIGVAEGEETIWYPDGDNYIVDADHAGEKTIYFRPDGLGGEGWFQGVIFIEANGEVPPTPAVGDLWKVTSETAVAAGSVYIDNDLLKLQSVYATMLVGNPRAFGDIDFTHEIQIRVDAWPTSANPTGTEKSGSTPLVLTAKNDVTITLYYYRQKGDAAENDGKDLIVYDQSDNLAKLTGVFTNLEYNDDQSYFKATKKLELKKGHVYTLCAKGTTIQLHGMAYAGEGGEVPPVVDHKFYITGESLVGSWEPNALPVDEDSYTVKNLKADVAYSFKVTVDGTWATAKGFEDLTVKPEGVSGDADGNVCFKLAEDGDVVITYTAEAFTVEGNFATGEVPPVVVDRTYYLVGSMTSWQKDDAFKFVANPDAEGEFQFTTPLAVGDGIKVLGVAEDLSETWYPDGMGNEYVVDENHAGEKTIYFRPAGNPDWESFHEGGFFYIEANGEVPPTPGETVEIRLIPGVWELDDAKFAAVTLNYVPEGDPSIATILMAATCSDWFEKDAEGEGYVGQIPADTKIIAFGRMAPSTPEPSIANIMAVDGEGNPLYLWNHSDILTIDPSMKYTIDGWPAEGKDVCPGHWGDIVPPVVDHKFYITGESLVGSWEPNALPVDEDSYTVKNLKADVAYSFKVTVDGTWATAKGFDDLTVKPEGVSGDADGNVCFKLAEDGDVVITYTAEAFTVEGNFATGEVPPVVVDRTYYLVGSAIGWAADEANKLVANPGAEGEFMITATLAVGDELKVIGVAEGEETIWYPDGDNYIVDADHAGEKTIYFRPAGNPDWESFHEGGFFYIEANGEVPPTPGETVEIRLIPGVWELDDAKFAAVTLNYVPEGDPSIATILMAATCSDWFTAAADGNGYVGQIPADTKIIAFGRMAPSTPEPSIANIIAVDGESKPLYLWNHTDILTIDPSMKYTIDGWEPEGKDCSPGHWGDIVPPVEEGDFYIVGSMTGWGIDANYKLSANPDAAGEYMFLGFHLDLTSMFKIVKSLNGMDVDVWYPDGLGNNYGENGEITEEGDYNIYFRPDGQGGEDWFNGFFFVQKAEGQGIEDLLIEGKAVKVLRDNQIFILKGDKIFNIMGTLVR